jgi:RNA polymerase sigma-70 factor (ECF subfamily)
MEAVLIQYSLEITPVVSTLKVSYRKEKMNLDIDGLINRVLFYDDNLAFDQLFKISYNPLIKTCLKIVPCYAVAEELVSEVLLKVWKNRNRIIIASSGNSYLFTSVRNIAIDYLRKEKKALWADLSEVRNHHSELYNPHQVSELAELQDQINHAVNKLPKKCRLVFQLSREEGLKYNEIAERLNISHKTVETQIGRALRSIKSSIGYK